MSAPESSSMGAHRPQAGRQNVSLAEAFRVWLRVALLSFGGPAGQIAVMHRIVVDEKRWISEARFLHALNYCMLLPGPEAQQLATYIGWLLNRTAGGLIAGILFIAPGAIVILVLSVLYAGYQDLKPVEAVFFGIKAAVLAVVIEAVLKIARRALKNAAMAAIAAAGFVGIFFFAIPFPLIVLGAALIGVIGYRLRPGAFSPAGVAADASGEAIDNALMNGGLTHIQPSAARTFRVLAVCLTLWIGPLVALYAMLGPTHVFYQESLFFSKMAVVTFGGAYAVLAYVAQQAVDNFGWLEPGEMLDGLGMAETTPGPLIMVLQFVGFLAAYRNPGTLDPMTAGAIGAALTTWMTFVPCFLWIFLGGPYVEKLRGNRLLSAALSAITAAVVGVVLNLAIWFSLQVIFAEVDERTIGILRLYVPAPDSIDWAALAIAVGALVATLRFGIGMIPTLLVCAAVGAAWSYGVGG